ncbi:MAG: CDP-alcohol phosphatidyltransferase family protein [archaeon]|nr:CDP-alcohol phosphatidyltransferase family protein [archaeon]
MVESIKELEKICLPDRSVRGRIGEHWITAKFQRKISIRLTWMLLHTPITANQASLLGFTVGILGAFLVSSGNYYLTLLAVFMLYLSEWLDSSDGEIARYRKTAGPKGEMLEGIFSPSIIHAAFFAAIAYSAFLATSDPLVFVTSSIGIIFLVKFDHAKELAKEYTTKQFHTSPADTIKKATQSPFAIAKFLGESKHLRNFLIFAAAVAGAFYWVILIYPFAIALSYLVHSFQFLSSIGKKN